MEKCPYCGVEQKKHYPLCHACGAIRYPVGSTDSTVPAQENRFRKLKLSASIAAALVTPGAFIVLAALGVNHMNNKRKKEKL